ncbi:MAG: STAS domain-containing protein [Chloroflexota bacterium]
MTISSQTSTHNISHISVTGRLDQSQVKALEAAIQHAIEQEGNNIIVDLSDTNYINSGGLRCLVTGWRNAKQQHHNLVLCGLNSRLQEIFEMVGFDQVFTIYSNPDSAIDKLA